MAGILQIMQLGLFVPFHKHLADQARAIGALSCRHGARKPSHFVHNVQF